MRRNLEGSFPDKTVKEIIVIEKQFYRHFCDYFFETIKLLHISDEEMKRRFVFRGMTLMEEKMKKGNSCIMMLGHYGNWEWVTSITLWSDDPDARFAQIYRPLKNKAFDRFFIDLRKRFHSIGFAKNDTLREIVKFRRDGKKLVVGFISDQKPSLNNIHYWTRFLNRDTAILTGAERIAKQTGFIVGYLDVRRLRRGYYEVDVKLISDDPCSTAEFEITERYARMMEATILRDPARWLWTHNRWKHKRQETT
ncbi:acetyltransferase [Bacteroidia bacterium]|nr:acetyltransferase [Bacteroidia bacterium]GHV22624.1 acetyltransferase [Bacteroidia bacterium]